MDRIRPIEGSGQADFAASAIASEWPDLGWLKKKVPIEDVARELGLEVTRHRARCWRVENHRHADADPSLRFLTRKNRARCFVCDQIGGFSNIDLVMRVLDCDFSSAVAWICERFAVPSAKRGSPIGPRSKWRAHYRVGTSGSEFELMVRSGLWAQLSAAQKKILPVLISFRDVETQLATISYRGIMRYAGIGSFQTVALAIRGLQRLHTLQILRNQGIGVVRACNQYRLTLDDPHFLELLNRVYRQHREEIERERDFRAQARLARQRRRDLV